MARPKRNAECGFALLFIFCMAAIVAILLLSATPRTAFEAARDQEQLLIDRGEQYKRAIQLYYRALHHYPPDLDQLEKSGNLRFLRRRYADPFTGEAEWRLIHVGPGGILTDSVNNKKKPAGEGSVNTFITELQQVGGGDLTASTGANVGLRRRASEAGAPGAPLASNDPGTDPNGFSRVGGVSTVPLPIGPDGRPVQAPPVPGGLPPVGAPVPVGGQLPPMNPNNVVNNGYPNPTGNIGGGYPNPTGSFGGPPVSGQANYAGPPGAPGSYAPSAVPGGQGSNAAASMIQNLLTSPRPGGYPGTQAGVIPPGANTNLPPGGALADPSTQTRPVNSGLGQSPGNFAPGQAGQAGGGAGIAGVASKDEHESIKVYNEKTKHNEWEFIYDYGKEARAGMNLPTQQRPGQNPPAPGKP